MTTKLHVDYEMLGAEAASYMLAPVRLGPELKDKVTALGRGTANPSGAGGIPLFTDFSSADYVGDESSLRAKPSKPHPLSLDEGREYAEYTPDRDDTGEILSAIEKDLSMMRSSEFSREVDVIPVSDMSDPSKGTKIYVSDFSVADSYRPVAADNGRGRKRADGPTIKFVHFKDAPMDKPYAEFPN